MNLRRPNADESTGTFNRSKSVVPMSGICSRCLDGCRGGCETFKATPEAQKAFHQASKQNQTQPFSPTWTPKQITDGPKKSK